MLKRQSKMFAPSNILLHEKHSNRQTTLLPDYWRIPRAAKVDNKRPILIAA